MTTNGFITKAGKLFVVVAAMQQKGELILVRSLLCACPECSKVDNNAARLNSHLVFVSKNDAPLHDNDFEIRGRLVDEKYHPRGYINRVAVDGRDVTTPSRWVAPTKGIGKVRTCD
jgi:hypothetical protein